MPQVKLQELGHESGWALWRISETEEVLCSLASEPCPAEIINAQKRLEWLAGRVLIKSLANQYHLGFQGIRKDEFGKPFLQSLPHHISLSHSFPYVAAQLDSLHSVGIDVEQPKEKLLKIAHRIMNAEELEDAASDVVKHCVYWCAKEALYKIHGKRGLHFSNQLNIVPFTLATTGNLKGKITKNETTQNINLAYSVQEDYVLVYTQTQPV